MLQSLHHVHIKSNNPKATADWYQEAFGFRIVLDVERPLGDRLLRCATRDGDAPFIIVSNPLPGQDLPSATGDQTLGLEHLAISTDDLNMLLERVTALGAKLVDGPRTLADGTLVTFVVAPSGERIELLQFAPDGE